MKRQKKRQQGVYGKEERLFDGMIYIVLFLVLALMVYPLIYVVSCSFSDPLLVLRGEIRLLPRGFHLDSYAAVLKENKLLRGYMNTILYTVAGTLINILLTTTGAYALSCENLRGRKMITRFIIFTMLFSGGLIPTYIVVSNLNLLNTMWSIVLPNAVSVTNFIIMKSSFENGIPKDLKEAARVEGCSNIGVFTKIVLPLSKSIIAVMVIFYSVGHWNEYFNALLYITDKAKQPLQVILRDILISNELTEMMGNVNQLNSETRAMIAEGMKYSTIVLSSLPMILLYPFFQKYFVKGVMVGSVKG
ncbi:carbohydrate ABC transporter permease [bacterium D16-50]|jgi:putative aldouronate transport system permease protein|nr:carbohydrate ABC transporter permease [Lachnospiraceae bacterium]RKJ17780.1 carbohydrate ABC transporter permease [bacterium D16-50]